MFRTSGLTEDELPAARKHYHERLDKMFADQTIRVLGVRLCFRLAFCFVFSFLFLLILFYFIFCCGSVYR